MYIVHFIVWMRTAGLPNFRKLWGRIDQTLTPGRYYIMVSNNYKTDPFLGHKSFVLSTTNAFGGQNYFIALCYIITGSACFIANCTLFIIYVRKKRKVLSSEESV